MGSCSGRIQGSNSDWQKEGGAVANPEHDPMGHVDARDKKGLRPGGFGILLSQTLADELLYNETQNEVVFVKYLDEPPAEEDSGQS